MEHPGADYACVRLTPGTSLDVDEKKKSTSPPTSASDDRPVLFVTRDDDAGELYVAALTARGKKTRRMRDCSSTAALLAEIEVAAVFIDVLDGTRLVGLRRTGSRRR